jgi:hypothetical protein
MIRSIVLLALVQASLCSFAQSADLDPQKWATELNKKGREGNESYRIIDSILGHSDSTRVFEFLDKLANKGKKDHHFQARFNCLKAHQICLVRYSRKNKITPEVFARKTEIQNMLIYALDEAYRSEDEYLISLISTCYGSIMIQFDEIGIAVMYEMNGIDLSEKLSLTIRPYDYQLLAELLYKVREYNSSIKYALKAAEAWKNINQDQNKSYWVSSLNTIALGYHRQEKYDSAFFYYNEALQLAKESNSRVWVGIVSGNLAQIYYLQKKYDTAYSMFMFDYQTSKDSGYYDNAANSLQWAARTNLALGKKADALKKVKEAFALLKLWPDAGYLRNTYYSTAQIFKEMKAYDSAFYYNNLYASLNDSLEKIVSRSSTDIARARLNDEASRYNIRTLNREKKTELMFRNMIIAGIIILSLFALLIVNRKRLKIKLEKEKVEQEKLLMEQEVASAKDQLRMFTENIIEKTNLIDKLESQIKGREATSEQQLIIGELSQQTILTEEDWNKFKSLFEKIYPGFFIKLKDNFPDITLAEQRMAALTRLHLTTRQIASMLGISIDSVHKSRQRLRQRFQVSTETNLDELVAKI